MNYERKTIPYHSFTHSRRPVCIPGMILGSWNRVMNQTLCSAAACTWLALRQRKHWNYWPRLHKTLRAILALWDRKTNQDDLIMCDREGGLAFVHNKNLMYSFTKISLDCIYILLHQTIWLHFLDFSYMLHTPAFVPSLPVSPAFCVPQRQAAMPTSVTELAVSSGRYRGTTPLHGCLLVFLVSERHLYRGLPWTQSEKALHPSHTLSPHLVLSSCLTEQA